MGLGTKLSRLTKPELEELEKYLNLTDDECIIFHLLAKNKSIIEISDKMGMSKRTTDRRISNVKRKVEKFMVIIRQGDKEIKDISEIKLSEDIKKLIASLIK